MLEMKKRNNSISLLSQFPHLVHGMTTKKDGDMREKNVRDAFFKQNNGAYHVVLPKQTHSTSIALATKNTMHKTLNADGIFTKDTDVLLGILTADCVPILFYESKKRLCGVVHAGWRGTLDGITQKAITCILNMGGTMRNTYVHIGAYIGKCCYTVNSNRIQNFRQKYGKNDTLLFQKSDTNWYLDLGYCNKKILIQNDIPETHIQMSNKCTACGNDQYFSYRKSYPKNFGEMISYIGLQQ